jgi:hypothetical protein
MWKFIANSKFYQINEYGEVRRLSGTIIRKDKKNPFNVSFWTR